MSEREIDPRLLEGFTDPYLRDDVERAEKREDLPIDYSLFFSDLSQAIEEAENLDDSERLLLETYRNKVEDAILAYMKFAIDHILYSSRNKTLAFRHPERFEEGKKEANVKRREAHNFLIGLTHELLRSPVIKKLDDMRVESAAIDARLDSDAVREEIGIAALKFSAQIIHEVLEKNASSH